MPHKEIKARKEYHKKYNKEHYIKNKTERLKKIRERKSLIKKWYVDYKSNLFCENCGESDIRCLDFHHKNPKQKKFSLSRGIEFGYSIINLLKEIDKCKVLCANCHRKESI